MLQWTRNKLEILAIIDAQIYTKILYRFDKRFNDWVQEFIMYPTNLDAKDWEVIDFRNIISNVKNMDFQPGPLPLSFSKFNATNTKTPKVPSNNYHRKQPSRKNSRKDQRIQRTK